MEFFNLSVIKFSYWSIKSYIYIYQNIVPPKKPVPQAPAKYLIGLSILRSDKRGTTILYFINNKIDERLQNLIEVANSLKRFVHSINKFYSHT